VSKPVQKPDAHSARSQRVSTRTANPGPIEPRQTVIRRVQAIIHVKREEDEDDVLNSEDDEEEVQLTGQRGISRKRRKIAPLDDEYEEDHQDMAENARDEPDNDYAGVEDVSDDHSEDDDDELMLGAEVCLRIIITFIVLTRVLQDNHHEVYGTQRVKTTKKIPHTSGASPANRKRKPVEPGRDKKPPPAPRRRI
jgi:hypothetical protein